MEAAHITRHIIHALKTALDNGHDFMASVHALWQ